MTRRYEPVDLGAARAYPIAERRNKVCLDDFGRPV